MSRWGLRRGLLIAGATLLGVSLLGGFIPMSAQGVNCGSSFQRSHDPLDRDLARSGGSASDGLAGLTPYSDACDQRVGTFRPTIAVLMLAGAGLLLAGAV